MMENLREVMQEETREFLNELARHADYPIERMTIACGELGHHIKDFCRSHRVDLVICGNHNHSLFSRATCSAKSIVGSCGVDVLLVSLKGLTPVSPFPEQTSLGKVAIFPADGSPRCAVKYAADPRQSAPASYEYHFL